METHSNAPQTKNNKIDSVDYVVIYHKHKEYELSKEDSVNLNQYYKLIYTSPRGLAELYRLKK